MKYWLIAIFMFLVILSACREVNHEDSIDIEPTYDIEYVVLECVFHGAEAKGFITVESNLVIRADVYITGPQGNMTNGTWTIEQPSNYIYSNKLVGKYEFLLTQKDESGFISSNTNSAFLHTGLKYSVDINLGGFISMQIGDGTTNS